VVKDGGICRPKMRGQREEMIESMHDKRRREKDATMWGPPQSVRGRSQSPAALRLAFENPPSETIRPLTYIIDLVSPAYASIPISNTLKKL